MKFASLKMFRERFDVTSRSEATHLTGVSTLAEKLLSNSQETQKTPLQDPVTKLYRRQKE